MVQPNPKDELKDELFTQLTNNIRAINPSLKLDLKEARELAGKLADKLVQIPGLSKQELKNNKELQFEIQKLLLTVVLLRKKGIENGIPKEKVDKGIDDMLQKILDNPKNLFSELKKFEQSLEKTEKADKKAEKKMEEEINALYNYIGKNANWNVVGPILTRDQELDPEAMPGAAKEWVQRMEQLLQGDASRLSATPSPFSMKPDPYKR